MAKYTEAQNRATQKYISKAYDQVSIRVYKGERDKYKAHAEGKGKSLNQLIIELLEEDLRTNGNKILALAKLYNEMDMYYDYSLMDLLEAINRDMELDYLTENECRNKRAVLWYSDENYNEAIYIDTLEFLTEEEIEKELC